MEARVITLREPEDPGLLYLARRLGDLAPAGFFSAITPFSATDGRGAEPGSVQTANTGPGTRFTPAVQAAIADSHMRAWEAAFFAPGKEGVQTAAFFEDDAVVRVAEEADFATRLAGALNEAMSEDADVLMLGCFSSPLFSLPIWISGAARHPDAPAAHYAPRGGAYTVAPPVALALHAYILTRAGATRILDAVRGRVRMYLDYEIQYLAAVGRIRLLVANPRLVYQTSTATTSERGGVARSSTAPNVFPRLLIEALSDVRVDTYVSARYIMSVEVVALTRDVVITPIFGALVAAGIALGSAQARWPAARVLEGAAVAYLLLVAPDIAEGRAAVAGVGAAVVLLPAVVARVASSRWV